MQRQTDVFRKDSDCGCVLSIENLQIYNEERRRFTLVKNQPRRIVEKVALDIEKLLAKKRKALDVSMSPQAS